ncbi:hypothetical protein L21SP2_3326 [Salinispira pacifica]|uniref:Uncharacterized protein n=2 Tax=Salinispira pacifica TaxID=1307761 RepID=V5WN80_9SPIO|nr:hypothetical protein L21SP2_3326 [Salinispira pacifica]
MLVRFSSLNYNTSCMRDDENSGIQPAGSRENGIDRRSEKFQYMLPFYMEPGMNELHGTLGLGDNSLCIEWRLYDLFESPKGELESLIFDVNKLVSANFRKGLFGGTLRLVFTSSSVISRIPLPTGQLNEMRCIIRRKHRREAELWTAELNLRIAENL